MTWPFENDIGAIVKKLAKRSLASEKRRNLMVADTYEAVFTGVEANHVAALKDMPELARSQMELIKGELPTQANEVAVSEYFLSATVPMPESVRRSGWIPRAFMATIL